MPAAITSPGSQTEASPTDIPVMTTGPAPASAAPAMRATGRNRDEV